MGEEEEAAGTDDDPDEAYACYSCAPVEDFQDVEDQIEQDIAVAFVCSEADLDDNETCELLSSCVHDELLLSIHGKKLGTEESPSARASTSTDPSPS